MLQKWLLDMLEGEDGGGKTATLDIVNLFVLIHLQPYRCTHSSTGTGVRKHIQRASFQTAHNGVPLWLDETKSQTGTYSLAPGFAKLKAQDRHCTFLKLDLCCHTWLMFG